MPPVISNYLKSFASLIFTSVELLPQFHLDILKLLPKRSVFEFFVHKFLLPPLKRYLCGFPFPRVIAPLKDLLAQFQSRSGETEYSRLFSTISRVEVASVFVDFDLQYVFFSFHEWTLSFCGSIQPLFSLFQRSST
jgi:hypothetical protein